MEQQELHRGRLIDHVQLVVKDLPAAQKFYTAIFEVLDIPIGVVAMVFSGQMSYLYQHQTVKQHKAY